jgi:flagellar biosynthesis GTPase FlhF
MGTTPMPIEMKIVAYIARGDTYQTIIENVQEEFGAKMAIPTISDIKKRNLDALEIIRNTIIKEEEATAKKLLEKSRSLIGKNLTKAEKDAQYLDDMESDFRRGKIKLKEYQQAISTVKMPTLTELTSVSKEMHHQDSVENQKISEASKPENAKDVWQLLKDGDDVELQRIVFGKKEEESKVVKPVEDEAVSQ